MVGLFVVAAGVTAVRSAGAAPRKPSRKPAAYAGRRLGRARHVRPTGPRPLGADPDGLEPTNPASRSDEAARPRLPAKRVHPASTTGEPGTSGSASWRATAAVEARGHEGTRWTARDPRRYPNAAVWVDLVSPTSGQTQRGRRPRSACIRSSSRTSSRATSGPRSRRPTVSSTSSCSHLSTATRSSPPRSTSSSASGFLLTVHERAGTRATRAPARRPRADPEAGPDHLLWAHRRRHRRRLLPVRRPARRRDRRRPGPGHREGHARDARTSCSPSSASSSRCAGPVGPIREVFNQLTNRDLSADRRGRGRLLPRHLRPRDPPDRRARQLPRARVGDPRRVPLTGQQQPVGDHEAPDRRDGRSWPASAAVAGIFGMSEAGHGARRQGGRGLLARDRRSIDRARGRSRPGHPPPDRLDLTAAPRRQSAGLVGPHTHRVRLRVRVGRVGAVVGERLGDDLESCRACPSGPPTSGATACSSSPGSLDRASCWWRRTSVIS